MYDLMGRKLRETDIANGLPESGPLTPTLSHEGRGSEAAAGYRGYNAASISYEYDAAGNMVRKTDKMGRVTAYEYDALNRKLSEAVSYSPFTLGYSYEYYANSQKKSYTAPDGIRYSYSYDAANNLTSIDIPNAGVISRTYKWNRPELVTYPGGSTRAYAYDGLMRVAGITSKDPGQNIIMDYSYTYDNADNITMKQTEHGAYNYTYDELYRLTRATNPNRPAEGFSYDPVGNRLTSSDTAGNWAYNGNNELRNYPAVTFDYDSNGNTVRKTEGATVTDYSWDAENRLMNVECHGEGGAPCHSEHGSGGILYSYDPFGRRLSKTVGDKTIYYFYSDEGLAGEFNAQGQVIKIYGFAPNLTWTTDPVFMKHGSNYYFYHNDHLGTPQKMTAVNGSVVWSARYESFGKATIDAGATVENNLRFPGQYYDQETGEHYNFHRYYNSEVGRYETVDPIGKESNIIYYNLVLKYLDANPYAYVSNIPINSVDIQGLARTCNSGEYSCPRGGGYKPPKNGCGPQDWRGPLVPEHPVSPVSFTDACNKHDICYGSCDCPKSKCDSNFLNNMIAACKEYHEHHKWYPVNYCIKAANVYFNYVSGKDGDGPYQNGQDNGCVCSKCPCSTKTDQSKC